MIVGEKSQLSESWQRFWVQLHHHVNNSSSPIALSLSSDDTDLQSFGEPLIPVKGHTRHTDTRKLKEAEVMDLTHKGLVWQSNNKFRIRSDNQ